jgi:transcriptional regulator with XRE-family HTH domain
MVLGKQERTFVIGRNGIRDAVSGNHYWAEWMLVEEGRRIFAEVKSETQEAVCYDADSCEFLGIAKVLAPICLSVNGNVLKAMIKEEVAQIRKRRKLTLSEVRYNGLRIAIFLEKLKRDHFLSFSELAKGIGVSDNTLRRLCDLKTRATYKTIRKIANFGNVTMEYLLDGKEN